MAKNEPEFREEAERFKIAREQLGVTQQQLAARTGISLAAVRAYERGISLPKRAYAQKLGKAGVNMLYIATGTGPPIITPDMYPKPNMYVAQPMKDNPAILTIGEVPADYDLEANNAKVMSNKDLEQYGSNMRAAEQIVDTILNKIDFPQAHARLKATVAHLLQDKNITQDGATAILLIVKDDYQFAEERVEMKMRSQYQDTQIEAIKAQARAEIAEARLEILKPQVDNFELVRDMLKRTQAQLAQTEEALKQLQADVTSIKKNRQQAA